MGPLVLFLVGAAVLGIYQGVPINTIGMVLGAIGLPLILSGIWKDLGKTKK